MPSTTFRTYLNQKEGEIEMMRNLPATRVLSCVRTWEGKDAGTRRRKSSRSNPPPAIHVSSIRAPLMDPDFSWSRLQFPAGD